MAPDRRKQHEAGGRGGYAAMHQHAVLQHWIESDSHLHAAMHHIARLGWQCQYVFALIPAFKQSAENSARGNYNSRGVRSMSTMYGIYTAGGTLVEGGFFSRMSAQDYMISNYAGLGYSVRIQPRS